MDKFFNVWQPSESDQNPTRASRRKDRWLAENAHMFCTEQDAAGYYDQCGLEGRKRQALMSDYSKADVERRIDSLRQHRNRDAERQALDQECLQASIRLAAAEQKRNNTPPLHRRLLAAVGGWLVRVGRAMGGE